MTLPSACLVPVLFLVLVLNIHRYLDASILCLPAVSNSIVSFLNGCFELSLHNPPLAYLALWAGFLLVLLSLLLLNQLIVKALLRLAQ